MKNTKSIDNEVIRKAWNFIHPDSKINKLAWKGFTSGGDIQDREINEFILGYNAGVKAPR